MSVDEAWHHKLVSRVDHLVDLASAKLGDYLFSLDGNSDVGPHRRDRAVDDQQIGNRGQVDVAVLIVDTAVSNEDHAGRICGGHWSILRK